MTLTASNLINTIHSIVNDLKQDIFLRFTYNLDENITFLDLTRNLILLENVISDDSIRRSQELRAKPVSGSANLRLSSTSHQYGGNPQISNSQYVQPEYSATKNPFNIQNQENHYIDTVEMKHFNYPQAHAQYPGSDAASSHNHSHTQQQRQQPQQQENYLDQDSIPQFHKELLKEYKISLNELKKQNKIIKAIVEDHTHSAVKAPPSPSHNLKKKHHERTLTPSLTQYNTSHHARLQTFETGDFSVQSSDQKDNKRHQSKRNKDKHQQRHAENRSSTHRSEIAARAKKELEDLQRMREKELHRVRQIEKAIKRREETKRINKASSSRLTTDEAEEESVITDGKRYIHQINKQISSLDKEIKSITQYIQNCILSEQ